MGEHIEAGMKFRHLTTLRATDKNGRAWLCFCICQRSVIVAAPALASGEVTSCGCRPLSRAQNDARHQENERRKIHRDIFGDGK